jgi:hypothetical protein
MPYSPQDEECDRLAFLALELGIVTLGEPGDCLLLAIKRLNSHFRDEYLNPGILPFKGEYSFPIPTSPPWELHALCHHSRLLLREISMSMDDKEIEVHRKHCFTFLTSEASIIPTWDRLGAKALRTWYSSEATCVIASTLLDIAMTKEDQERLERSRSGAQNPEDKATGDSHDPPNTAALDHQNNSARADTYPEPFARIPRRGTNASPGIFDHPAVGSTVGDDSILEILKSPEVVENFWQGRKGAAALHWKGYKPSATYHPESFYSSLDDSPELFRQTHTMKTQLQKRIRNYLTNNEGHPLQAPGFHTDTIGSDVPIESMKHISVIDLKTPSNNLDVTAASLGYTCDIAGLLENVVKVPAKKVDGWERSESDITTSPSCSAGELNDLQKLKLYDVLNDSVRSTSSSRHWPR